MKKIFAALLVGLMAVSVTACSNSGTQTTNSQSPTASTVEESKIELAEITKTDSTKDDYLTDTKLYKCFYEKAQNDAVRMTIKGDIESSGISMSISMDIQKQGDKTYMAMNMFGMDMKTISKDGFNYALNDSTKQYSKTALETSGETDNISDSISSITGSMKDIKFIENGLSSEEDTTDYEKYSSGGSIMTIYFNGDDIKYIETEVDTSETSIESSEKTEPTRIDISVTNEIDESLFEVPSDYEEVDTSDLYGFGNMFDTEESTEE